MKSCHACRAFTLVELLVVIGIVGLMTGALGLSLGEGNSAGALRVGQGMIASLLAAGRGQAALGQTRTTLLVDADPASESFLRRMFLAEEIAPDSGQWRIGGAGAVLPRGIYLVPAAETDEGTSFGSSPDAWPTRRRSTTQPLELAAIDGTSGDDPKSFIQIRAIFLASGAPATNYDARLVLAAARRTKAGVKFGDATTVRGAVLSSYGIPMLIDDGPGFDL